MTNPPPLTHPLARPAFMGVGLACVGLGTAGAFLPGLPTTVFLLIASYCFARSNRRLETWLWQHRLFGPFLRAAHHGMPRRAKVISLAAMWVSVSVSVAIFLTRPEPLVIAAVCTVIAACVGSVFIVRVREPVTA